MIYSASAIVNDQNDPHRRSWCLFYAHLNLALWPSIVTVGHFGLAILAMGLERGIITSHEALSFKKALELETGAAWEGRESGSLQFKVDLNAVPGESSDTAGNVGALVDRFEEIELFSQLTGETL